MIPLYRALRKIPVLIDGYRYLETWIQIEGRIATILINWDYVDDALEDF